MKKITTHDTNPAPGMTPADYENGLRAMLLRRSKLAREAQIGRRVSRERWLYYRRDLVSLNDYILGLIGRLRNCRAAAEGKPYVTQACTRKIV